MRRIGSIPHERDAQRFAAHLVTLGIDSHTEQDSHEWAIWVRDENRLEEARDAFDQYRVDPSDSRYRGAEREAESIRRAAAQQRQAVQQNVVEMRGRWKSPGINQHMPLTLTMIALSIAVSLVGGFGKANKGVGGKVNDQLSFVSFGDWKARAEDPLASLAKGQLWRTITPIFIHGDFFHLLFNMFMFFQFGRIVESMRGTARFAVLILLIAVISNVAQAVAPTELGGTPLFGGMSGVVYGLFGYAWMKSVFDPQPGYQMSQVTVIILMCWLFLCMTPAIQNVANVAHVVGLIVGAAAGYLPTLMKK